MKKLWLKIKSFFASKPEGNPEGISEITNAIVRFVDIAKEFEESKSEYSPGGEKIVGSEYLSIGKTLLPLFKTYKNRELLFAQFKDFTTPEGSQLAGELAKKGIIGDRAMNVVVLSFSAIDKLIDVYNTDIKEIIRILRM